MNYKTNKRYIMKTTILKALHQRSILELELIDECDKRIRTIKSRIIEENHKGPTERFLFTSLGEYENRIKKLEKMKKRLKVWYFGTFGRIKKLSYDTVL